MCLPPCVRPCSVLDGLPVFWYALLGDFESALGGGGHGNGQRGGRGPNRQAGESTRRYKGVCVCGCSCVSVGTWVCVCVGVIYVWKTINRQAGESIRRYKGARVLCVGVIV